MLSSGRPYDSLTHQPTIPMCTMPLATGHVIRGLDTHGVKHRIYMYFLFSYAPALLSPGHTFDIDAAKTCFANSSLL